MPNTEIKLIATDLDGTLLRDDHLTLSPANREALTRAADAGIEVVVATGRSLAAVAPQVLELPFLHYFITCNGSITTDREGHILRAAPLPLDTTLEILEHLTTMGDFAVQLYADQKMYLSRTDWEHRDFIHLPAFHLKTLFSSEESIVDDLMERARQPGTHLEKINMPYLTPEQKAEIKVWLAQRYGDRVRAVSTMECNLELTDREGSKGAALAALCQMLNIPTAQVMALYRKAEPVLFDKPGFIALKNHNSASHSLSP